MDRRRLPLAVATALCLLGALVDPPNIWLILLGGGLAIAWLAFHSRP